MPYPEDDWQDNNGCFWALVILAVACGGAFGLLAFMYCIISVLMGLI